MPTNVSDYARASRVDRLKYASIFLLMTSYNTTRLMQTILTHDSGANLLLIPLGIVTLPNLIFAALSITHLKTSCKSWALFVTAINTVLVNQISYTLTLPFLIHASPNSSHFLPLISLPCLLTALICFYQLDKNLFFIQDTLPPNSHYSFSPPALKVGYTAATISNLFFDTHNNNGIPQRIGLNFAITAASMLFVTLIDCFYHRWFEKGEGSQPRKITDFFDKALNWPVLTQEDDRKSMTQFVDKA